MLHLRLRFRDRERRRPAFEGGRSLKPADNRGHEESKEGAIMARSAALPMMTAEGGLSRYLEEIRRFPMLEPQEEYMLAAPFRGRLSRSRNGAASFEGSGGV